jgi:hypothetical protein
MTRAVPVALARPIDPTSDSSGSGDVTARTRCLPFPDMESNLWGEEGRYKTLVAR